MVRRRAHPLPAGSGEGGLRILNTARPQVVLEIAWHRTTPLVVFHERIAGIAQRCSIRVRATSTSPVPAGTSPRDLGRGRNVSLATPLRRPPWPAAGPAGVPDARRPVGTEHPGHSGRAARADRPGRVVDVGRGRPRSCVVHLAPAGGATDVRGLSGPDLARRRLAGPHADCPAAATPRRAGPVRQRIRRAWAACGNSIPVEIVRILQVRISRRPWPRPVSRVASGTARQGRPASWACRLGWLPF